MKKLLIGLLAVCLLVFAGGCAKKEEIKEAAVPTAQVAYAAYQYEEGYRLSEGWMYDMTVSAGAQLKELEELVSALKLTMRDEMFEQGRGYYLVFRDAAGGTTDQLLILENGTVSRDGLIYEAANTGALLAWLDALEIEEQNID